MLVGREAERAAIDRLVDDARQSNGGALVIRGPAGIGKSALCEYGATRAGDLAVSRVNGLESEIALGFAGLHQLVAPFIDLVAELPPPQRGALESVFGLAEHQAPDQLFVFLAVLTLLDVAAKQQPMLLVVDDAQWLDDESARVLTFVAHRLRAEAIAMLFAVRDTAAPDARRFDGLPHLEVGALVDADAHELLRRLVDDRVDPLVADQLVSETCGSPLALAEFVRELSHEQLRGDAPLPDPLPVGPSLQDEFARRARSLPSGARDVLLLAAAERFGDPDVLRRATAELDASWEDAARTIEAADLATFGERIEFRHPLVRSGVYHGAASSERRRAHRALAEALDGDDHADRRAWHLAAAAVSPGEDVAAALEAAAERALRRGGMQVAAQFLLRSSELTPDPVRRIDRLLDAVRLRASEGDAARAQPLLDAVLAQVHDPLQRGRAEWTQGLMWLSEGRGRDAVRVLARAVGSFEVVDGVALEALATAEDAVLYAGSLVDATSAADVASAALRLVPDARPLTATQQLVRGIAQWIGDGDAAAPTVRDALRRLCGEVDAPAGADAQTRRDLGSAYLLAVNAATAVLDDVALQTFTRSWVDSARATRSLAMLPVALDVTSVAELFAGRFGSAEAALAEADDILTFAGSRGLIGEFGVGALLLCAHRGDEERTREIAQRRAHDARERGSGVDLDQSHYALAVLDAANGRYEAALDHCREVDSHTSFAMAALVFPLLVEAAVRCDDTALAHDAIDRIAPRLSGSESSWARGVLEGARALVASDAPAADDCYRAALDHLERSSAVVERARMQLLYGEWLRRRRLRREARASLRAALELFETVGADAFAQRARTELAATGETARPRSDDARDLLTPQEAQIARLVASGCTNADIASRMFISTSTVEYHLRKIFRKLDVRSRTQLARLELLG